MNKENNKQGTGYFDKTVVKELFSAENFIVEEIDLDEEEYVAKVLIEVNAAGVYLSSEIGLIVTRILKMENVLIKQGFIHDIRFGDLVKGCWMIFVHFLNEEEIEKWEENAIKGNIVG